MESGIEISIERGIENAVQGFSSSAPLALESFRLHGDEAIMRLQANVTNVWPGGDELVIAFGFKAYGLDTVTQRLLYVANSNASAARIIVDRLGSEGGRLRVLLWNSAGTACFSQIFGRTVEPINLNTATPMRHVLFAWRRDPLTDTGEFWLYLDGVQYTQAIPVPTITPLYTAGISSRSSIAIGNSQAPLIANATNGEVKAFYMHNALPDMSTVEARQAFVDKFYKNSTILSLGTTGEIPTGTTPVVYFTGDANDFNFGRNKGSATGFNLFGYGSDYGFGQQRIAFRPTEILDNFELGTWTPTEASTVSSRTEWPRIAAQSISISNTAGSIYEGISKSGLTWALTDVNKPLHLHIWSNNLGAVQDRNIVVRIWDDGATANYTEYLFATNGELNRGCQTLSILPQLAQIDVDPGDGYLPERCYVSQNGTGWIPANGIQRVDILWQNLQSQWNPTNPTRTQKMALCQLVRGYGHTPVALNSVDDGNRVVYTQDYPGDPTPVTRAVAPTAAPSTVDKIYDLEIPTSIALIGNRMNESGSLLDAQLAEMQASGQFRWSSHGSESMTGINAIPVSGLTRTAFILDEIFDATDLSATFALAMFIPDSPTSGVIITDDTDNASGWGGGNFQDAGLNLIGTAGATRKPTPAEYEAYIDFDLEYTRANLATGAIYDYVYPKGGYRNGTQETNEALQDGLVLAGMETGRSTVGSVFASPVLIPDTAVDYGVESMAVGGLGIELTGAGDTARFPTLASIVDNNIGVTLMSRGGCTYYYWHTPRPVGSPASTAIVIDWLFAYLDKLDEIRATGKAKVMFVDDYRRELKRHQQFVVTHFTDEYPVI